MNSPLVNLLPPVELPSDPFVYCSQLSLHYDTLRIPPDAAHDIIVSIILDPRRAPSILYTPATFPWPSMDFSVPLVPDNAGHHPLF